MFVPEKVYFQRGVECYPLGRELLDRYSAANIELIEIDNHNKIPELREKPDSEYTRLKKYLIVGIRKSLRLLSNNRSADYIVPFTSSGCTAMCLYCYLVCTFFKNSYLRVFVNREEMMDKIRKMAEKSGVEKVYEIGSNSDMVLENGITGNLEWAITQFASIENARCTFATKFADVEPLLKLKHRGKTQIRISVNPSFIIKKVEIGTSPLMRRIEAANMLFESGYRVGINIAPIILFSGWREHYFELLEQLERELDGQLKRQLFFELIFMTYGLANEMINRAALPGVMDIFDKCNMRPKGRGKYCYKKEIADEAGNYILSEIKSKFPESSISYVV
jgi:spore photoproduct lyase